MGLACSVRNGCIAGARFDSPPLDSRVSRDIRREDRSEATSADGPAIGPGLLAMANEMTFEQERVRDERRGRRSSRNNARARSAKTYRDMRKHSRMTRAPSSEKDVKPRHRQKRATRTVVGRGAFFT